MGIPITPFEMSLRTNSPVTQREHELPDNATLMSTTDTQSHITYANAAFVNASGFSLEEIQQQPHNLVRHPDMPKEAFGDMWATLKGGEPWSGLVKNRRKNGDHYWVLANATPVIRHGKTVGYMSVRTPAARDRIAGAEALYVEMRAGRARHLKFHKGLVLRTGLMGITTMFKTMRVRHRIRLSLAVLLAGLVGGAWALGMQWLPLAGLCAVGVGLAGWFLESQLAGPLEVLREQALRVATGDTRDVARMERVDEIGMAMRSISQLGLMFRWLIDDVSQQVLTVRSAVSEIAQGNNDLSQRTEQAAASLQQTAASMEQMTASVRQNAETSRQANQLAGTASDAAARGGQAVSQVVQTMGEITERSRKIHDIIGVIDGIAFQTNILALNAAVEAARAGEQGRGFAVVAGEVRGLARRSAEAAKEIKALIGASVDKVEAGTRLVDATGKTMEEIVHQVQRVSDLINQISSSTTEQSSGIQQVSLAVGHLDEVTQQNAALVEQGAAASQSLQQQTRRLVEAVSVFR